jgi:tetratricopeptide (TPR) repeat protein
VDQAGDVAAEAVALTAGADAATRADAHELAARVALARKDDASAVEHAAAAQQAEPRRPVAAFVRGRLLYEEGKYDEAAAALQEAAAAVKPGDRAIPELHLYLGESLAHLDRFEEAESQYREELSAFPRSMQAYSSLAMLYSATRRDAAVEDVLNELVSATPTPESYGTAARLWTILGDRSRAEALRSDARARFRGDPSLALLGRDGRR